MAWRNFVYFGAAGWGARRVKDIICYKKKRWEWWEIGLLMLSQSNPIFPRWYIAHSFCTQENTQLLLLKTRNCREMCNTANACEWLFSEGSMCGFVTESFTNHKKTVLQNTMRRRSAEEKKWEDWRRAPGKEGQDLMDTK